MRLTRTIAAAALLLLLSTGMPVQGQDTASRPAVRVWEDEVVIPTYRLGEDDLNPHFQATSGSIIYPYSMQDGFTTERVDRAYRAVFLENEYLRVMCLPEIGGRIQSVYDKTAGEEMFYRNNVIRPGHIALRGAWVSGGVEWNRGPQGHTVTSFSPVDVLPVQNPDGSASLLIGGTEQNHRTGWQVTLTLHPGEKLLDERIRLYNPTDGIHPYYFWNNTAFPNRAGTRFIFPMSLGMDHHATTFFDWPVHEGRDLTWLRSYPEPTSVFGYRVTEDFFGAYDVDRDYGIVQVADHRQLPGKKAWTWGEADAGLVAQSVLTDDDGPYIEVQSGPLPTQSDLGLLLPGQEISWQEFWYPVAGLVDGFEYATRDVAVQRQPLDAGVRLRFTSTREMRGMTLLISREGGRIENRRLSLSPAAVEVIDIDTSTTSLDPATVVLRLRLQNADGDVLMEYASPPEIAARTAPQPPTDSVDSAETRYREADTLDRNGNIVAARAGFRRALELDPGHAASHRALGVLDLEAGMYPTAARHLEAALARDAEDGMSWYLLAAARLGGGDLDGAAAAAAETQKHSGTAALGHSMAGRIAARNGNYDGALREFTAGLSVGGADWTRLLDMLVIAAYAAGENEQVRFITQQATQSGTLRLVPHVIGALARGEDIPAFAQRARGWLGEPEFAFLEASLSFADLGLYRDAAALLEAGCWAAVPASERRPLPAYYMAYFHSLRGDDAEASHWLTQARGVSAERVFPSRPEALAVLSHALEDDPGDARATLYLGNLLAGLHRYDEAAQSWAAAASAASAMAEAWRNLGLHQWKLGRDLPAATESLQRAVAARPGDQTLYRDLARVLRERDLLSEAISVLESVPASARRRADVTVDLASAYLEAGRFDESIAVLAATTFTNREGNSDPHRVHSEAHLGRGQQRLAAGDAEGALADFDTALTYPVNLNVGRPHRPREAAAQMWRGMALEALGRGTDAAAAWRACAGAAPLDAGQVAAIDACRAQLGTGTGSGAL